MSGGGGVVYSHVKKCKERALPKKVGFTVVGRGVEMDQERFKEEGN